MPDHGERDDHLRYQRAKFAARFPRDRLYAASHLWLLEHEPGIWRIGFTLFAMRMLGEPVDIEFQVEPGTVMERGQTVGWLEGFKAVTDLYTPMAGRLVGTNPRLAESVEVVKTSPYSSGWLYAVAGTPGEDCVDAEGYARFLDGTIDRMMEKDAG